MWISAGWWVSRVRFRLVDKNLMIRSYSLETRKESRHEMAGKWREQIVMLNVSCLSEWDFLSVYHLILSYRRPPKGKRRRERRRKAFAFTQMCRRVISVELRRVNESRAQAQTHVLTQTLFKCAPNEYCAYLSVIQQRSNRSDLKKKHRAEKRKKSVIL